MTWKAVSDSLPSITIACLLGESGPGRKGNAAQVAALAAAAIDNAFWVRAELQLHCATKASSGLGDDDVSVHGTVFQTPNIRNKRAMPLTLRLGEGVSGSLVVGPHAEHAHDPLFGENFVHETIVNVDSPRVGTGQIAYEFLERRRIAQGIDFENVKQLLGLWLEACGFELLRIFQRLL